MKIKNYLLSWVTGLFAAILSSCFIFGLPALFIAIGAYAGWWEFSWIPIILLTMFFKKVIESQKLTFDMLTFNEMSDLLDEEEEEERNED